MLIWTKNCQSRLKQSEYICDAVEVLSNPSNPVLLRIPPDKLWEDAPLHSGSNENNNDLKKEMQRNKKRFLAVYDQVLSGPVFKRKWIADKSWLWPKPQLLPHSRYNCPPCAANKHKDKTRAGHKGIYLR